ncbi:hypothetical protein SAMN05192544_1001184 [Paraburkholderia hospita]|jgi:hypothetical protein|nr:hypothetical protein SAMN05192544_1001184 [Paraburkholderia hospita]
MPVTALRCGLDARQHPLVVDVGLSGRVVFCSSLIAATPHINGDAR